MHRIKMWTVKAGEGSEWSNWAEDWGCRIESPGCWESEGRHCRGTRSWAENSTFSDFKLDFPLDARVRFLLQAALWYPRVLAVALADGVTRTDKHAPGSSYRCCGCCGRKSSSSLQVLGSEEYTHTCTHTELQCKLICVSFSMQNPWLTEIWYQFISPHPFPSIVFRGAGGYYVHMAGLIRMNPLWSSIDFTE